MIDVSFGDPSVLEELVLEQSTGFGERVADRLAADLIRQVEVAVCAVTTDLDTRATMRLAALRRLSQIFNDAAEDDR